MSRTNKEATSMLPKHRIAIEEEGQGLVLGFHWCDIECACGWRFGGGTDWSSPAIAKERALSKFYAHCLEKGES